MSHSYTPSTALVQSLLRISPWQQRHYIEDLVTLERLLKQTPRGFATNLLLHTLKSRYPVEVQCILEELAGHPVSVEVLFERLDNYRVERNAAETQQCEREHQEDLRNYTAWRAAGGRP